MHLFYLQTLLYLEINYLVSKIVSALPKAQNTKFNLQYELSRHGGRTHLQNDLLLSVTGVSLAQLLCDTTQLQRWKTLVTIKCMVCGWGRKQFCTTVQFPMFMNDSCVARKLIKLSGCKIIPLMYKYFYRYRTKVA